MSARVLSTKIPTSKTGVFYKQIINEKDKEIDRVYLIRYKSEDKKDKLLVIGKKSEGITIEFSLQKRMEILTKQRFGDEAELLKNKRAKKSIQTLDTLAEIYFDDTETSAKRRAKYYNHIKPFFGNRDIKLITKEEILLFRKALLKGSLKYPKKIPVVNLVTGAKSKQTVNGIIELIKTIYNYHIKEKDLNIKNPCLGIAKLNPDNRRERFLLKEEIEILIESLKDKQFLFIFVNLSLQTGGRLETILNIQKKDIDLVHGIVTLKNLKTGETYKGFLKPDFMEYLQTFLNKLRLNDYVVNIFDKSIKTTSRQIQSRLKPVLDKMFNNELETDDRKNRVVIHTMRHTFASHLAINGTPIFTIKELMNHKDIEQTMRYAKLSPDSGKEFVSCLYK